jgi:hypothetical protein
MAKGHKILLGATVEPQLIKELDALRGEVPRSRLVERALNWYLKELERNGKLQGWKVGRHSSHVAESTQPLSAVGMVDSNG